MRPIATLAFVARSVDYGDTDRVVTLLSEKLGKITALARGARRSRRRFGAALRLFVLGEASLRPGRGSRAMPLLQTFDAVENLSGMIGADVAKVAHGSYVLEVSRELWPASQQEPAVFALLLDTLRALARSPAAHPLLLHSFELQLLKAVGLAPSLDRCVSCGSAATGAERCGFSATQGGVICGRCGPHGWLLARATIDALRYLAERSIDAAPPRQLAPATCAELRDVTRTLLGHHVGKRLQSVDFIEQLNGAAR